MFHICEEIIDFSSSQYVGCKYLENKQVMLFTSISVCSFVGELQGD